MPPPGLPSTTGNNSADSPSSGSRPTYRVGTGQSPHRPEPAGLLGEREEDPPTPLSERLVSFRNLGGSGSGGSGRGSLLGFTRTRFSLRATILTGFTLAGFIAGTGRITPAAFF